MAQDVAIRVCDDAIAKRATQNVSVGCPASTLLPSRACRWDACWHVPCSLQKNENWVLMEILTLFWLSTGNSDTCTPVALPPRGLILSVGETAPTTDDSMHLKHTTVPAMACQLRLNLQKQKSALVAPATVVLAPTGQDVNTPRTQNEPSAHTTHVCVCVFAQCPAGQLRKTPWKQSAPWEQAIFFWQSGLGLLNALGCTPWGQQCPRTYDM